VEEKIHEEIRRMERLGVIEPSSSDWSHPLVAVAKPSGKTRVCMDCRKINAVTVKDSYPVPNLNRILGRRKHTNRQVSSFQNSSIKIDDLWNLFLSDNHYSIVQD
jgi:hypothetical protein